MFAFHWTDLTPRLCFWWILHDIRKIHFLSTFLIPTKRLVLIFSASPPIRFLMQILELFVSMMSNFGRIVICRLRANVIQLTQDWPFLSRNGVCWET